MKITTKVFAIATFTLLAATTVASAQPGRGRHHGPAGEGRHEGGHSLAEALIGGMGSRIADRLELTEGQRAQAKDLAEDLRAAVQPLREGLEPLHDSLRAALDAAAPNPATVGAAMIEIDATRDQIKAHVEQFEADFRALLTAEQIAKLDAWRERREERGGSRGRGPRGGGGR